MKLNRIFLALCLLALLPRLGTAQQRPGKKPVKKEVEALFAPIYVGFYNVENLFDTLNDPKTRDEDFLPEGALKWDSLRFQTKLKRIAQVMADMEWPEIMGFCEVENRAVLEALISQPEVLPRNYTIIHFDSPDERGIDVAMLVKTDRIIVQQSRVLPVKFSGAKDRPTRDVLYARLQLVNKDYLHIMVNHWPSRTGGEKETAPKRALAAQVVKHLADSLLQADPMARIIIMGDFNDHPKDASLTEVLKAETDTTRTDAMLYNLMAWREALGEGTHRYKEQWGMLDQMIVSKALLKATKGSKTCFRCAEIMRFDYLFEKDKKGNLTPFRTYAGKKYLDGYSDHLPIRMRIELSRTSPVKK